MALNNRGKALLPYLENPYVLAFLDTIADAEGVRHGYRTGFGNEFLDDLSDHPRTRKEFTQTDGQKNLSSAAGRYQFLEDTWDDVSGRLGLADFTERNQDLGALELIRRRGVLDEIAQGKFDNAFSKLGVTWASLPSSPYKQPKQSNKFVTDALANHIARHTGETSEKPSTSLEAKQMAEASQKEQQTATTINMRERIRTAMANQQEQPVGNIVAGSEGVHNFDTAEDEAAQSKLQQDLQRRISELEAQNPDWVQEIQTVQTPRVLQPSEGEYFAPWEEELLTRSIAADADDARNEAQAAFFGEQASPRMELPKSIERAIARVVSLL